MILFLDPDGVLHPIGVSRYSVRIDERGRYLDHRLVGEGLFRWAQPLIELLDELPRVRIVIHGICRLHVPFSNICAAMPAALVRRVVGCTPTFKWKRIESIRAYCNAQDVQRFVILDNVAREFPNEMMNELVLCGEKGLSNRGTLKALRQVLAVTLSLSLETNMTTIRE